VSWKKSWKDSKGLKAHSNPNMTWAELIDQLCELGFKEWDPAERKSRNAKKPNLTLRQKERGSSETAAEQHVPVRDISSSETLVLQSSHLSSSAPRPQKVSVQTKPARESLTTRLKREVWRRSNSRCNNCGSTFALQIDHVKPIALGGTTTLENLRLLCRSCNQRAAIQAFGVQKIYRHLHDFG
jgi:hypothetical protein